MTSPALAHQTSFGRMYSRKIGGLPEVPSITTVIGQAAMSMDGWIGHMAASAVVQDVRLSEAVGSSAKLRTVARDASNAAEAYRDAAAARGDRVHTYCEQVALRALGRPHAAAEARARLEDNAEGAFASRFDDWWDSYGVEPIAAEVTIWNHTVGYAGTLDLVARIGGRLCLIDYKTKGTGRDGRVKALDPKVVMQLAAGYKAEEVVVDAEAGVWEDWAYGEDPMLLGVAIGETEVQSMMANPAVLPAHWRRFWALRQVWDSGVKVAEAGLALRPVGPPAGVRGTPPGAGPAGGPAGSTGNSSNANGGSTNRNGAESPAAGGNAAEPARAEASPADPAHDRASRGGASPRNRQDPNPAGGNGVETVPGGTPAVRAGMAAADTP